MKDIKIIVEAILVVQFVIGIALIHLYKEFYRLVDIHDENIVGMAKYINKLNKNIGKLDGSLAEHDIEVTENPHIDE